VSFQEFADLGRDIVPDLVELRVEDTMNGLGRGRRVSTLGEGERIIKERSSGGSREMPW
jgi:hypothetical protein